MMRTLLIGHGAFGRLAAEHLGAHTELSVIDRSDFETGLAYEEALGAHVRGSGVVVLAVPVQAIEGVCRLISPALGPGSLVVDVASVKVKPSEWMDAILPADVSILGTHPCFGPETAATLGTIADQPIAFCPVRGEARLFEAARTVLAEALGLRVLELTPDEHDRQMALVQVLTHLVGHAAQHMRLPDLATGTLAYRYLLQMQHNTDHDSAELFEAIQHLNPHAAGARERFREAIDSVLAKAEPGRG